MANIAETLIEESNLNPAISDVFVKWDEIIGEDLARFINPHKVIKMNTLNILIVRAKNCCATEVQHDSLQILDKLNKYFRQKLFSSIRVIQE